MMNGRRKLILLGGAVILLGAGALAAIVAALETDGRARGTAGSPAGAGESTAQSAADRPRAAVVLTPAKTMRFEQRLAIAGTVLAKRFALVSARIPGTLDAVFVDEGDVVEAGKTRLFQTDAVKLEQALAIARHQLTVAECAVREKEALMDKTLVALEQARIDLARYRKLRDQNAMANQTVEHQEAQCRQLETDVRHVQTLIDLSKAQWEQAKLNVRIAEKDLADSLVVAPLSGRVSKRLKEPGEMAGAGTPVFRIDDGSLVEVSVFVPAEYYDQVQPGQTRMRVRVGSTRLEGLPVTFRSPTVEPRLRTFQVKALIESPPPEVVPGALAHAELVIASRQGVGVPSRALVARGGRTILFTVVGEAARELAVEPGMETDGWREILSGLSPGAPVVTMGQTMIEDGAPVRVVEEAAR